MNGTNDRALDLLFLPLPLSPTHQDPFRILHTLVKKRLIKPLPTPIVRHTRNCPLGVLCNGYLSRKRHPASIRGVFGN